MNNSITSFVSLAPLALGQMPAVSSTELGSWLLAAAAVAVIANQAILLWRNISGGLKEMPPPADTYVTKTVCKIIHSEVAKNLAQNEDHIEGLRREIKEDVKGIHNRINDVLTAVSRLQGHPK